MANPLQPPYLTHAGSQTLYLASGLPIVNTLQALTGSVSLTSPDSSITITPSGQNIQLQATGGGSGVTSLSGGGTPLTGAVTIDAGTGITVSQVTPQTITIDNAGVTALNNLNSGVTLTSPDASITIATVGQDIQLQANIPPPPPATTVYQATYFKTTVQNLTSGNTDITFDGTASWNNDGGYITHTNGTTAFTVVQTGLYQLEFNATVLVNNGSWLTTSNRSIAIDVTRPSIAEQGIVANTAVQGVQSYAQSANATYYLVAGDVINMRISNTYTGGIPTPPQAQSLQNTFDLNTFFSWTYISPAGAAVPVIRSGIYTEATGGSTTATITASGITASSVVVATFIHPPSGGGSRHIRAITPTTNTITVLYSSTITVGDQINWIAYG